VSGGSQRSARLAEFCRVPAFAALAALVDRSDHKIGNASGPVMRSPSDERVGRNVRAKRAPKNRTPITVMKVCSFCNAA
jgi:hypothetical protein